MATIGFFSSRARAASRSKPATESKASICRPSEETRSSSIRPSAISDRPVCAWLPAVIRKATGRPRFCIVMLMAMLDDWVMIGDALAAFGQPDAAMLVGPQQRAVGIVDQAVAVRPDDRHLAGRADQLVLQPLAVVVIGPVSRKPAAKQMAPPAPRSRSALIISMVRWRLTPMKAASGAPGSSATER